MMSDETDPFGAAAGGPDLFGGAGQADAWGGQNPQAQAADPGQQDAGMQQPTDPFAGAASGDPFGQQAAAPAPAPAPPTAGTVWSKGWDSNTQRWYYCNNQTGQSTWERPADYDGPEDGPAGQGAGGAGQADFPQNQEQQADPQTAVRDPFKEPATVPLPDTSPKNSPAGRTRQPDAIADPFSASADTHSGSADAGGGGTDWARTQQSGAGEGARGSPRREHPEQGAPLRPASQTESTGEVTGFDLSQGTYEQRFAARARFLEEQGIFLKEERQRLAQHRERIAALLGAGG